MSEIIGILCLIAFGVLMGEWGLSLGQAFTLIALTAIAHGCLK
jgi:hypothetical protein